MGGMSGVQTRVRRPSFAAWILLRRFIVDSPPILFVGPKNGNKF